jgi:hypothetical protein
MELSLDLVYLLEMRRFCCLPLLADLIGRLYNWENVMSTVVDIDDTNFIILLFRSNE